VSNESIIPTPATPDVCTLAILIGGQDISGEFQVLSLSVSRELNRIPAATIQIQDGEPSKSTFAVSNTANFIPGMISKYSLAIARRTKPCSRALSSARHQGPEKRECFERRVPWFGRKNDEREQKPIFCQ